MSRLADLQSDLPAVLQSDLPADLQSEHFDSKQLMDPVDLPSICYPSPSSLPLVSGLEC